MSHLAKNVHRERIAAYNAIRSKRLEPYKEEIDEYFRKQPYNSHLTSTPQADINEE